MVSTRTGSPRPEKIAVVDEVRSRLSNADGAILTEYRGLKVKDLAELRRALRASGGDFKIYKNTLVRFAVRDLELGGLEAYLTGPTAIAFVGGGGTRGDVVAVAKTLRDYARTNPALVVKGGIMGKTVINAADAGALADVAPREVLLARVAGMLASPMTQFASLLSALPRNFAYGLKALIEQQGGGPSVPMASATVANEADSAPSAEPVPAAVATEAESAAPASESPAVEPSAVVESTLHASESAGEPAAEPESAGEPAAEPSTEGA